MGLIYKLTSPSGKQYIGLTINSFERRMGNYRRSEKYNGERKIDLAIKKYGFENFVCEIVEDNINNDTLREKEIFYIQKYDTYNNGYNSTLGGDAGGYELNEKSKKSMSRGTKKFWENVTEDYMTNHKKKASETTKKQWQNYTEEQYKQHCEKLSMSQKGRVEPKWKKEQHSKRMTGSGNSMAKQINIYNSNGDIMFKCNGNFKKVCDENNLPHKALRLSHTNNGQPIIQTNRSFLMAEKKGWTKFKGWYAKVV